MALNDAVPSSATDVYKRNAEDADKLLNASGPVTNRIGNQLLSWEQISQSHAAWNNRGAWTTATAYAVNDIWEDGGVWYVVLSAYTSGASAAADIAGPNIAVLNGNFGSAATKDVGTDFDQIPLNSDIVYPIESVQNIAGLIGTKNNQQVNLKGWHAGWGATVTGPTGGGILAWDSTRAKSSHNGATIFSPTVPYSATTADYLNAVGETDGAGSGCWVRVSQDITNLTWFGTKGDGTTDDRLSVFAAMDYVSSFSGTLFCPIGDYRVTAGYTNSSAYNDIRILGEGVNRENLKTPQVGTTFTLDSTNPGTFFYKQASRHFLQVENVIFRCAQYTGNRRFFIFDNGGAVHNFKNVTFEDVEKPINYTANCYFQNAAFRDVQFRESGTFHSESNNIVGTLLLLNNVNHEGVVPLNTDKVVCDLRGIREVQGSNFLLEGSLAETGWTVIRTDATASTDWIQSPTMLIDGFHSEWSINLPTYTLDLVSGYYKFSNSNAFLADGKKCRLNTKARLVLEGVTITSGTPIELGGYFELVDLSSTIALNNCGARLVDQPLSPRITLNEFSRLDTNSNVSNTLISGNAPLLLAAFDGGYFDDDLTTVTTQNGTAWTPSTDATHGRKAIITAGTSQRFWLSVVNGVNWPVGEQFIIKARIQLPTFTGGTYRIAAHVNFTDVSAINYDSASSGSIIEALIPFRLLTAQTTLGVNLADNNPTGVSGAFEVLTLEIYQGANITNTFKTLYPKFVTTYGASAPAAGAWKRGDKIYDSTPSAAGTIGWVCTASGAPGTWKTFGAITA